MILRTVGNVGLLFLFTIALIRPSEANQIEESQLAQIKSAIIHDLCREIYLGGGKHYKRDVPLPLKIKIEGNKFYAKLEKLGMSPGGHITQLYQIGLLKTAKTGGAVVTHNFERDIDNRFIDKSVINDTFTIPSDCTPRFDTTTPQKELMLRTIVSTMKNQLGDFVKLGIWKYQGEVTLIIADFNIDYPETYILVEPMKKVYGVRFHDPENYDSDEYEREGEYPFGEEYSISKELLAKIRKHGIIQKITLTMGREPEQ